MKAALLAIAASLLPATSAAQQPEAHAELREQRLVAWLQVRDDRDRQFAAYARYRRVFARAAKPAWLRPLEPLLRTYAERFPVRCDAAAVARLCADAHARLADGGAVHELLPWLSAVSRQQPEHLEVQFLLVHVYGTGSPVHDAACADMHWQAVADALAQGCDVTGFVPEGGAWLRPHWRRVGERLAAREPLRRDWLAQARYAHRDQAFAAAVVAGDRAGLERHVRTMVAARADDAASQLLLALVLMSRGSDRRIEAERCVREYQRLREATRDQGAAIDRRLRHLGVLDVCRACGLDVATPQRWFEDATRPRLRFAFPDFDSAQTVRTGLRRKIARAEEHVASGQALWQHHHDKQQQCLDKARLADRRTRRTYWRNQAAKEEAKKDVHARAITGKRETIRRYQDQVESLERALTRMRSFKLGG